MEINLDKIIDCISISSMLNHYCFLVQVREAWEAYKSAQEKAALREADYQEDMTQLERAKTSDREGMTAHVKAMETGISPIV